MAKVLEHKTGLKEGKYGRITSKELGEFVGEVVEITVKRKKEE